MQEVFEIICTKEAAAEFHKDDFIRHVLTVQYGIGDTPRDFQHMRLKSRYALKGECVRLKFVRDPLAAQ